MASRAMVTDSPATSSDSTVPLSASRSSLTAPSTTVIAAALSSWSWKPVSWPGIQQTT